MLIRNDYIQAALISKLKADANLVAWLTSHGTADEIREVYWQGVDFEYPAVRVALGTQTANPEAACNADLPFTVYAYVEGDSSQEADELAHKIVLALDEKQLSPETGGWRSGTIISDSMIHAIRTGQRIWRATCTFRTIVYETSS